MEEVYMSIELGQLKSILETAKKLQNGEIKTPTTLKGLIDNYNLISYNNGNPTDLPTILPFDEKNDISWDYISLAGNGSSKLANLIVYTEGYINAHTPIPPVINKIEGWSEKKFWGLTAFVVASCIAICAVVYQIGVSDGKSETQREYDEEKIDLSQKIDSLKTEYNITNDSLKACNVNIISKNDSLKECNAKIITKSDSISFLLPKDKQVNNKEKGSAK